jgi:hypothetical protein
MDLWIVGKVTEYPAWEFIGVFDTEIKAINACIQRWYFVAPVTLNSICPDETVPWDGAYYPNNKISESS